MYAKKYNVKLTQKKATKTTTTHNNRSISPMQQFTHHDIEPPLTSRNPKPVKIPILHPLTPPAVTSSNKASVQSSFHTDSLKGSIITSIYKGSQKEN